MASTPTVISELALPVAVITLNRPDTRNAFNVQQRAELLHAITEANNNNDIRVVIITGAGKGFCAGADLADVLPAGQTVEQRINNEYKPVFLGIAESAKTYIAAVNGVAAGIGVSLALACDLVVMSEDAFFYQAFSAIGLIPDGGLSQHLTRQLGAKKAFEVLALGQRLAAQECLQSGLINRLCSADRVLEEATALAQELLTRAPLSLQYTKEVMRKVHGCSLGEAISIEAGVQMITSQSADFAEGKAAFLNKRKPVWQGR